MENTVAERKFAAFLAVTLTALAVPLFGVFALIAFIPAAAACFAAVRGGAKILLFIPGCAGAVAACFAFGLSPELYGAVLGVGLICGAALGFAVKRRASATAQTVTAAVVIFAFAAALVVALAYTSYGSLSEAIDSVYKAAVNGFANFSSALDRAVEKYAASDPQAASMLEVYSLSGLDAEEVVRSLTLSLPGIIAAAAFLIGWIEALLSRVFLIWFGRRDLITDVRRLAVPASLAIIFFVLRIVTFFASGASLFAVCASNVVTALYPIMLFVGAGFLVDIVRSSRSGFSIMFIIMFALAAFFMPAVFVSALSAAGVVGTVVKAIRDRRAKDE